MGLQVACNTSAGMDREFLRIDQKKFRFFFSLSRIFQLHATYDLSIIEPNKSQRTSPVADAVFVHVIPQPLL